MIFMGFRACNTFKDVLVMVEVGAIVCLKKTK